MRHRKVACAVHAVEALYDPLLTMGGPAGFGRAGGAVDVLEGFWAFYLGTLIMGWGLLALLVGPPLAGTYLHLLHSVVSLYGLHWMKGATDTDNVYGVDTGALTFWEQIDDGKQWTSKRKAFFAVPIFLYLLATNTAPMFGRHKAGHGRRRRHLGGAGVSGRGIRLESRIPRAQLVAYVRYRAVLFDAVG